MEAAQDDTLHRRIEVADQGRWTQWRAFPLGADEAGQGVGFERQLTGEDFIQHQAERVNIALDGDLFTGQLLRRHVGRSAVADFGTFDFSGQPGESEIGEEHLAAAIQHDVRGLQVAVEDALLVRGGEPGAEFARDFEGLIGGQPANPAEQGAEVFAIHVLHGEEILTLQLAEVIDAADVGMGHLARHAHLIAETRERLFVSGEGLREEFEGYLLFQDQVVGAVHLAHPSLAQEGDHTVAAAEEGPRREASLGSRRRGAHAGGAGDRSNCARRGGGDGPGGVRIAGNPGAASGTEPMVLRDLTPARRAGFHGSSLCGGEEYGRGAGDDDGVLVVRRQAAVGGADGPTIGLHSPSPRPAAMIGSMVITRPSVRRARYRGS